MLSFDIFDIPGIGLSLEGYRLGENNIQDTLTVGFFQLGESENGEVCIKTDFEIFLNAF